MANVDDTSSVRTKVPDAGKFRFTSLLGPIKSAPMADSIVTFVPSRDPHVARTFYEGVLGLTFVSEDPFAVVVASNGVPIRIANVSSVEGFEPFPFTILGWTVNDVAARIRELTAKGVTFRRYEGMDQDALGIWTSPSGARVAWFSDPDGNVLSLTQDP